MATTPNPPGMHRYPIEGRPARRYEIWDGPRPTGQLVGTTERIDLSPDRYWRAHPAGGSPEPRDFPHGSHQDRAMRWLRDPGTEA
jgi:hypothetical protein